MPVIFDEVEAQVEQASSAIQQSEKKDETKQESPLQIFEKNMKCYEHRKLRLYAD